MAEQGFATWRPTDESRAILAAVQEILTEYEDYLPLTGRQIFYRLVAAYGYDKSERAANKLYGILGRARRAMLIPFSSIRDGGGTVMLPRLWEDLDAFWDDVRDDARYFRRDRQAGQPHYIELFCEAPGMMDQLRAVAFPYGVPVYGTRGFAGLSVISGIATRALARDRPTVLLQVGDFDPSGVGIFETIRDDAGTFIRQILYGMARPRRRLNAVEAARRLGVDQAGVESLDANWQDLGFTAVRVALTEEQVEEYAVETAPPSRRDSRSKNWVGETAQLEALRPDELAELIRREITGRLDLDRFEEEREREAEDRAAIEETLEGAGR